MITGMCVGRQHRLLLLIDQWFYYISTTMHLAKLPPSPPPSPRLAPRKPASLGDARPREVNHRRNYTYVFYLLIFRAHGHSTARTVSPLNEKNITYDIPTSPWELLSVQNTTTIQLTLSPDSSLTPPQVLLRALPPERYCQKSPTHPLLWPTDYGHARC